MNRKYFLGILFFSGLWGLSEVFLGGLLYRFDVPLASVPLTIIAFGILAAAWVYMPRAATGTLIAACAMMYKFSNEPFFACHLLGILIAGICWDVFFGAIKAKSKSVGAAMAVLASNALFAILMVFVFRYEPWVAAGWGKMARHIFLSGGIAAVGSAVVVPMCMTLAERFKSGNVGVLSGRPRLMPASVVLGTAVFWAACLVP
jgi:hypothetical protein